MCVCLCVCMCLCVSVCLCVCVSKITREILPRFARNSVGLCRVVRGRTLIVLASTGCSSPEKKNKPKNHVSFCKPKSGNSNTFGWQAKYNYFLYFFSLDWSNLFARGFHSLHPLTTLHVSTNFGANRSYPWGSFGQTGPTDGRTDGPTDRPTDGRTQPLIEMRGRI